jgi:hypothetical protein
MSKTRICVLAVIALAMTTTTAHSKVARCDRHHPHECAKLRAKVHKLQAAVEWQKHARNAEVHRVLENTRGAMPFAYAAKLAYAACVSFSPSPSDCRPPSEMLKVGRCESGLQMDDPNPSSTASNWMQFLDDTWRRSPVGQTGWFSKLDPLAVAIASEAKSRSGWHEWRASIGCHGLA